MITFFDPTGKEITVDRFIEFYSQCYYLSNSKVVEDKIEKILSTSALTMEDVMLILRWKLGRINNRASQRKSECIVQEKDKENNFITYTGRGKEVRAEEFCKYVSSEELRSEMKGNSDNPQDILNLLKDSSPENIGVVYLLTVLYFITGAEYPIYDRFAMMAVTAIEKGLRPGEEVYYRELPQKNEKRFSCLLNDQESSNYLKYIQLLNIVFGLRYSNNKKDRDIDRALWVYGHLFQSTGKKEK